MRRAGGQTAVQAIFSDHRASRPFIIAIDASGAIAEGYLIKQAGTTVYTTREVPDRFLRPLEDYNEQLKERYAKEEEEKAAGKGAGEPDGGAEGPPDDGTDAPAPSDATPDEGGAPPPDK
jgi:hypothetical protein